MTLFLLDTDAALNAADAFKDVTKKFYNLSYTVDDYDITSSDFNFKAVKSLIANNIQACAVKASNTACYINKVVTGHTELQKKEKYEEEKPDIPDFEKPSTPVTLPPTSAPTNVPTTPIPSGPTTIYTTSPPINLYYPARVVAASSGGVASVVAVTYTPEPTTPPEEKVEEKEVEGSKKVDVKVDNISHEEVDKENLNSAGRFMFEHDDFGYDESGYAKVGDRYVISCTEEYGVVGDEINIKLKDGSIVKCIIGQLNDGESSRLNFFVNDSWSENGGGNLPSNLASNIANVSNLGFNDKYSIRPSVSEALDWAYDLANGKATGGKYDEYNETNRFGYSSFALSSYKSSGIKIDEKEGEDIRDTLENAGFEKVSNELDMSELKPGDILIDENDQMKMYYGNGKVLEEFGDVTGASSKFGVRLTDYSNHSWNGILRYTGDKTTTVTKKVAEMSYADVMEMEA